MKVKLTYNELKEVIKNKGHIFFESGPYDVNLYGIRSESLQVDEFNDILGIAFKDRFDNKINFMSEGTTKPGLYWLKKKMGNINGTAILIPGQYRGVWKISTHKGYEALAQSKNGVFKVWRDNDADGQFDYNGKIYTDVTGLNMHTESLVADTEKVGAYSAGCQVRKDTNEHFAVIDLLKTAASIYGNSFSYTLLEEDDL